MSLTTIESDDDSPAIDKCKNGGSAGGGATLKKGPWTSAEDSILIDYVKKHGEGNWNAVQKFSGLSRCGKSCRLRWANHLRPNLKKGAFSAEEERLIVELHAKMGNKWARMAAHLPGRTDNEIKNYWNTRIKRRQRAGLPLYPAELCMQGMQDGQQGLTCGINDGTKGHDVLHGSIYEVPDVFDSLKTHQGIVHYVPELPDVTTGSLFMRGFGSSQYGSFVPPTMHRQKRLRESPSIQPGYGIKHGFPSLHSFHEDSCGRIAQSFGYCYPEDCDNCNKNLLSFGAVQGGHSLSNGNSSASKPNFGDLKPELPSLQFSETDLSSWGTPSSPPAVLESVDNYIQSPPRTGNIELECVSPRNSGLLDALVYGAKSMNGAKNYSSEKSSNSSTLTPGDMSSSTLDACKTEWDEYGDPISPLGHSATSIFSECTPVSASGSSMDDPPPSESFTVYNVKSEPFNQDQFPEKCEIMRPDALLASDWFGPGSGPLKDQEPMSESIAMLLGDGLCDDYKQSADAYATDQGWGFGSCPWNNLPAVHQMSELP